MAGVVDESGRVRSQSSATGRHLTRKRRSDGESVRRFGFILFFIPLLRFFILSNFEIVCDINLL